MGGVWIFHLLVDLKNGTALKALYISLQISYSQTFVLCDVRLFLIYLGFQLPLFIYKRLFYDYAFYKKYPKTEVDALHLYFMMFDCEFGAMHVVVDIRHRPECEERNRTIGQAHQGKHIYRVWWKRFVTFKIFVCLIFIYVPMNLYCISSISENWCLHYHCVSWV